MFRIESNARKAFAKGLSKIDDEYYHVKMKGPIFLRLI